MSSSEEEEVERDESEEEEEEDHDDDDDDNSEEEEEAHKEKEEQKKKKKKELSDLVSKSREKEEGKEEMSDPLLKRCVQEFIPKVDLAKTGLKHFVKLLSEYVEVDLKHRKEFIKDCLMEAMDDQEAEEKQKTKKKKNKSPAVKKKRKATDDGDEPKKKKRGPGTGGLSALKQLSPELAAFLGKGESLPRTEIVKLLWEYIREHDLQNPENKKEILLDDAMQSVFGCKEFTMFTMNKYISAHIHPFPPVDLTAKSPSIKPIKKKKPVPGEKKKPGAHPPHHLSEALQALVGESVLPRTQVVSKIWDYIKANELQNPNDRREIICDDKLKKVMSGQAKVGMFDMNKHVTQHILEKAKKGSGPQKDDNE